MKVSPWSDLEYGNEDAVDPEVDSHAQHQVTGKFSKNLKSAWNLNLGGTFLKHV